MRLLLFSGILLLLINCKSSEDVPPWVLVLHKPTGEEIVVSSLPQSVQRVTEQRWSVDGIDIQLSLNPSPDYTAFEITASSNDTTRRAFLSLRRKYGNSRPWNFNGVVSSSEIYRQSPHDIDAWIVKTIPMQAVPIVAIATEDGFDVAVSSSPFEYDNFSTQYFNTKEKFVQLSSGDNGSSPGVQPDTSKELTLDYNAEKTQRFTPGKVLAHYPKLSNNTGHRFRGLLFHAKGNKVEDLRRSVNTNVAKHYSESVYHDYFGALAFTTAYMNLRKNDTGNSEVWVVPAVEYSNRQYGRDAFWIAMMLSQELSSACLRSELASVNHFAEYPLLTLIWAYRHWKEGLPVDLQLTQKYVDAVEARVRDDYYYSFTEADGRLDFQYWGDVMAFEKDDVITYNQGLYALAISAAKEMGLRVSRNPEAAKKRYQQMYHDKDGFFPISKKKNVLAPDPLVGDVLSQMLANQKLLDSATVASHYSKMVTYAKTPYGFKVVSTPGGDYLPAEVYDIPGYVSQVNREKMPDGQYFRGGSYFLYDNLFLLDAVLHRVPGAEAELQWRVGLDFNIGGTTFECINTKTGEPWKPNMGWNVAIYALMSKR